MTVRLAAVITLVALAGATPAASKGQGAPAAPQTEEELRSHLEFLRAKVEDDSLTVGHRERLALEMATALDRAAQVAEDDAKRRTLWAEAVTVLDRFRRQHPGHSLTRPFEVQAGVYLWASAQANKARLERKPTDQAARERATADLNGAAERLRLVAQGLAGADDVYAQNARFRLAQTLADLAALGPDDPTTRRAHNEEALAALGGPIQEPSLQGFALLLRADLLTRLGRFAEAQGELDKAAALKPPHPAPELLDARLALLLAQGKFDLALTDIEAATVDPAARPALRLKVRLAERAAKPDRVERATAEAALFADLGALKAAQPDQAAASLAAVGLAFREPATKTDPGPWELMAEAAVALDDPARAGALERQAAEIATAQGQTDRARADRLKAGAYLFQAGQYAEADTLLAAAAADPAGGPARARAGLLLALSRGRALSENRPGSSLAGYAMALETLIKDFPTDPSAAEARWLLGQVRLVQGQPDASRALWSAVPPGQSRWLESRVELARLDRRDLENQRLNGDRSAADKLFLKARQFLDDSVSEAKSEREASALLLEATRLELTPGVGRPAEAQRLIERLQRSALGPDQNSATLWLAPVALAHLSRFVEAESFLRKEVRQATVTQLLEPIRLLDRSAAETESDLKMRRLGLLLGVLISAAQDRANELDPALAVELGLRKARALLFSGDPGGARKAIVGWSGPTRTSPPELLRDLAELYWRLDAFGMAEEVQRMRVKKVPAGSLPWLDARYGLALAYFHQGRQKEALHLIDATAILHPDLGGGELRDRFLNLRRRMEPAG